MGERKGTNKYYPPDYDPKVGGLNKFLGTHALRERANKIHLGILIIRFEMPYNIWCDGCGNHIGMGVRYNAEKTKIGMYYSTPVYQFHMKCHLCDNYIDMKTDPGNLDYVIVSGARRQENRWDPTENGQIVPDTKEVQRRLFDDPMFKLEHVANDANSAENSKPALGRLYERNYDVWKDNYQANYRLRAAFREKKKELKITADLDNALLAKSSLDIELLPENEQDKEMAALMRLQTAKSIFEMERDKQMEVMNKPVLPSSTVTSILGKRTESGNKKLSKIDLGIIKKRSNVGSTLLQDEGTKVARISCTSTGNKNETQIPCAAATEKTDVDKNNQMLINAGIPTSSSASVSSSKEADRLIDKTPVASNSTSSLLLLNSYESSGSENEN